MNNIMLDLETFGYRKSASICQLGAIYFDINTGETGEELYFNIDARTCEEAGAIMDADTVYWWLSQSKEAITSILKEPKLSLRSGLEQFNSFYRLSKKKPVIWSHSSFDMVVLTQAYQMLKMRPEYCFRNIMDIRTLIQLSGITVSKVKRVGTHHDALDDCKHQIKYCSHAYRQLKKRG